MCATVLALCCCAWEVMARDRLGLSKGEPRLGKGHGCSFGDVHKCLQPGMGFSFFWSFLSSYAAGVVVPLFP